MTYSVLFTFMVNLLSVQSPFKVRALFSICYIFLDAYIFLCFVFRISLHVAVHDFIAY